MGNMTRSHQHAFAPLWRKHLSYCAMALLAAISFLLLYWELSLHFVPDPMFAVSQQTPSRIYTDASGTPLYIERTYEYQWRIPVHLEEISPDFLEAICTIEDRHFREHSGVSYTSIFRAFIDNLLHRRVVSGASTITMQLVSLPDEGKPKGYRMKLRQALLARKLERLYDKDRILCEYVNRIPFGGKIYGIEAASWYYFDKPASRLQKHEAILLAGIPKKPNGYRPDRHPARCKSRQLNVIARLVQYGDLSKKEADAIAAQPLHFRDFHKPSMMRKLTGMDYFHYRQMARAEAPNQQTIAICLKPELQDAVTAILSRTARRSHGIKDAACVVLDAHTSKVLAMVGTLDFNDALDGQVNAAIARRAAGSTLKPFIFAEAIDAGRLNTNTILNDRPMRIGDYIPANFDGTFSGDVQAIHALSHSLNIPALRLLQSLGTKRIMRRFATLGLVFNPQKSTAVERKNKITHSQLYDLTIGLGTAGHSLLNLTAAYTVFANDGLFTPCSFSLDLQKEARRIYSKGAAAMIALMLRQLQLPSCTVEAAWKTGTSNGLNDAWCIAFTPDYVVGVWFGNKTGKASPDLIGIKTAAPAAGEIISLLHANKTVKWQPPAECLVRQRLCRKSGCAPSPQCKELELAWCHPDYPVEECKSCQHAENSQIHITFPKNNLYMAQSSRGVELHVRSDLPNAVWYIDNRYFGQIEQNKLILFPCGLHQLYAMDPNGERTPADFSFNVQYE